MKRKRHTPEQIIRKLRTAEQLLNQGQTVADVCRTLEVSAPTYHRWQQLYGGMCQATVKTGPEATRKLVHPVEQDSNASKECVGAPLMGPLALEIAVQTPQDVEAILRLTAAGWGRRRIAKELGFSPETV